MTNIRRFKKTGQIYFLTHVTYKRQKILINYFNLLWDAIKKHKQNTNFDLIAWVILPDHCHLLLNPLDNDLSLLMRKIKLSFSTNYRKAVKIKSGRIWQYRYWDHIIRNENDFNNHINYIHYNPVKHGHTDNPFVWEHSSINKFSDWYDDGWGVNQSVKIEGDFGE